jgi:hypothetical protein
VSVPGRLHFLGRRGSPTNRPRSVWSPPPTTPAPGPGPPSRPLQHPITGNPGACAGRFVRQRYNRPAIARLMAGVYETFHRRPGCGPVVRNPKRNSINGEPRSSISDSGQLLALPNVFHLLQRRLTKGRWKRTGKDKLFSSSL